MIQNIQIIQVKCSKDGRSFKMAFLNFSIILVAAAVFSLFLVIVLVFLTNWFLFILIHFSGSTICIYIQNFSKIFFVVLIKFLD